MNGKHWTKEECYRAVEDYILKTGRLPMEKDMRGKNHLPSYMGFQKYTGETLGQYLARVHPELVNQKRPLTKPFSKWTQETIQQATDRFFQKYGRYPRGNEYCIQFGLPTHNTFMAHFGMPAGRYWRQRYPLSTQWTEENAMSAIQQFIDQNGRLPQGKELGKGEQLPQWSDLKQLTGASTWSTFKKKYFPEFAPREWTRWTREMCIQAMDRFIREHGKYPTQKECALSHGLPRSSSFERCVGKDVYTYCKEAYPDVQGRCKQSWNREKCIAAVDGFCRKAGQPPLTSAFRKENGLPDPVTFKKHVGKTPEVYIGEKYTGISRKRGIWNKERCTEAVAQFILLHGHYPQVQDCKKEHGLPRPDTFVRYVGEPVRSYYEETYPEYRPTKGYWTRDKCIEALEAAVKEYGRCPTVQEFRKDSVLPSHSLSRQQVGQPPLQYWNTHHTDHAFLTSYRQQKWNDERICQAIDQFAALHGRLPKTTEFNSRNSLPSAGTVTKSTVYTVIRFLQQQYPSYFDGTQMVRQKEKFRMKMMR